MNSQLIYKYLKDKLQFEREEFWTLGFDINKKIIFCELVFLGTLKKCKIYPREIFRLGLKYNADQLIIAHTHPAGSSVYPSKDDITITQELIKIGKILDLEIADHLIISTKKYFSFYDEGYFSSNENII